MVDEFDIGDIDIGEISPGAEMASIRGYEVSIEGWEAIHEIANKLGFDTALDLVSTLMKDPEWLPEQLPPDLSRDEFQAVLDMREAVQDWNPIASELGGWGILLGSGGWSDIFIKYITGNPEQINVSDLSTAMIETVGAAGVGNALKSLQKIPIIGTRLGGAIDELFSAATRFGRFGKQTLKTMKDVDNLITKAADIAGNLNIGFDEALRVLGEDDFLKTAQKIALDAGDSKTARMIEGALRFGKETFEEAVGGAFKEGAAEIFEALPRTSIDDAAKALKKAGFSDNFVKRFISEAKQEAVEKPLGVSIENAFKYVSSITPKAGITPQVIKSFKFAHPTAGKILRYLTGGAGIGTGLLGLKGLQEAAFGGFMFEEAEQMTMFAQFFTADDLQALARTIANTSLPIWDLGETWADSVGRPMKTIVSAGLGEGIGGSIFTGPAIGTHESFTKTLIDKIINLQEKGAWTGFEGDPAAGTIVDWGRPTTQSEINSFLNTNPQYYAEYENEMFKLAAENPALLYQLYYEGLAEWYDLPGWMRDDIEAYKQNLKDWQYKASRGELTGQDALNLAESLASAIWYGQEDKQILSDAISAGNLVKTMIDRGEISEAKGNAFLTSLSAKLRNNDTAKKMVNLDASGKVAWKILTEQEIAQNYGSLTTMVEQPQLVFTPPGTTFSAPALTPYTSGLSTDVPGRIQDDLTQLGRGFAQRGLEALGYKVKPLTKAELTRQFQEFAKTAKGTIGIRGVAPIGELTPAEREALEKVPSQIGPPIEGLGNTETRWVNAIQAGQTDWATLQRLNPETYRSLSEKGYGPDAAAPALMGAAEKTELASTLGQFMQAGMISEAEAREIFMEATGAEMAEVPGVTGVFEYPAEGYTEEDLLNMLMFGSAQEQATARQQLEIERGRRFEPVGGLFGYERMEVLPEEMSEQEAEFYLATYGEDLSAGEQAEFLDALKRTTPETIFFRDIESEAAKEAAYAALGIVKHVDPMTGVVSYGRGRIRR